MKFIKKYILAGKRLPFIFYLNSLLCGLVPRRYRIWQKKRMLKNWEKREDAEYIRQRVDLYCRINDSYRLSTEESVKIKDVNRHNFQSRYAFDAQKSLQYFPGDGRVRFIDGDIRINPEKPSLMKCRRLDGKNEDKAVILNLDSIRHWLNPIDRIPFEEKIPKLFFRGDIFNKPDRIRFFEQWADSELFDLGDTNRSNPSRWQKDFVTVPDHFKYQFILALEGYDMASSLQWILASGCIPVMPKPKVEGWLMHSRLIPGVHYIEIKPDFSDVGEKIEYYASHQEEAKKISMESRKFANQFKDKKREKLISILTVDKYLKHQKR